MELKELKNKLVNKEKIKLPLIIFNQDDSNFLLREYTKSISDVLGLKLKEVNSIEEIKTIEGDVFSVNDFLFIYYVNDNNPLDEDSLFDSKVLIICNKDVENTKIDKVVLPKPIDWQIEDLVHTYLPGLDNAEISWLCKVSKYDVNRLYNEAQKITIFDKKDQDKIFNLINKEDGYRDLNDLTIFNLSNAILKHDVGGIHKVMRDLDNIDIEGIGLVTILLNNFYKVISIQLNPKATAQSLGMTEKQFRAIQYSCNKYSNSQLIGIYRFLNSIDYKLKSGLLDMTNNELTYYVLSHIL